jgi:hypothetical protein
MVAVSEVQFQISLRRLGRWMAMMNTLLLIMGVMRVVRCIMRSLLIVPYRQLSYTCRCHGNIGHQLKLVVCCSILFRKTIVSGR